MFVAGDAAMGPATVIRSVAEGKRAAVSIDKSLRGAAAVLDFDPALSVVDPVVVVDRRTDMPVKNRVPVEFKAADERRGDYNMYEETLSQEAAVEEAGRCLSCGCGVGCQICEDLCMRFAWSHGSNRVQLDREACVACGMCSLRCPNHNIEMVKGELSPARVGAH